MNNGRHPESLETGCVVGLVISEGYDHLRDAGAHCLSRRADAAVVNDRPGMRQQHVERSVVKRSHCRPRVHSYFSDRGGD